MITRPTWTVPSFLLGEEAGNSPWVSPFLVIGSEIGRKVRGHIFPLPLRNKEPKRVQSGTREYP
jgi:hypothetical protein